jgi:hypothetical protein
MQLPIIVDDGRYFNELDSIKQKGGFAILIYRPGSTNTEPHPSESEMGQMYACMSGDKYTYVTECNIRIGLFNSLVVNSGNIGDLNITAKNVSVDIMCHFGLH